jgi:molybdopterin-containing oxidoreductase family membrane subunit
MAAPAHHFENPDQELIVGQHDNAALTKSLFRPVWAPPAKAWWLMFLAAGGGASFYGACVLYTFVTGIGVWGNNIPVGWAFDIINFVWWIGIGHAGTLISAILLLFIQKWRTSINRFAEAMTIFAVMCAAVYPVLHTGRPWFTAYWLFPYPNTMQLWPQFKSPLMWDVFAVSTYFITSLLFWYLGLIPDLAALRDASTNKWARIAYGIPSLGWRGSAKEWTHWQSAYGILAGLSTPLVLSVHTIVSFDFAVSLMPGWHATIFPPYFVAGAVFSGFAMVVTLIVPARQFLNLKHVITDKHLENMNKIILTTSMMVGYGYFMEWFTVLYGGNKFETHVFGQRLVGVYAPIYYTLVACNVIIPHLFWFKKARTSIPLMWIVSILVNVGMWTERFIIIVGSLYTDFLPSKWHIYIPTWVDVGLFLGSLCVFSTLFLLFLKFLPAVAVAEVKEFNHELQHERDALAHEAA